MDRNTRTPLAVEEASPPVAATVTARSWAAQSRVDSFLRVHGQQVAVGLAILAAMRIVLFITAFPLTNTIDERFHLATIQMYSEGHLPGKELPPVDPQLTRNLLLYWSPEFGLSQQTMDQDGVAGPLYKLSPEARNSFLARDFYAKKLDQWLSRPNFEGQSAPLYYVVAAGWYKLGEALGMRDWVLDYWPRLLNPLAYAALVWLSYCFVRRVYPERAFLHLAVSALIAVFPQDVFYGMNRDVFSAPLAAAALVLMMRALDDDSGRYRSLILGSFVVGLAFLSSVSNLVLYGALAVTLWVWTQRSGNTLRGKIGDMSISAIAAGLLPSLWMLRNYVVMGDLTGGRAKAHELGWTVKPLAEMFHHPLFSLGGLHYFATEVTQRLWRGEYVWRGQPMKSAAADWFYMFSSALFVLLFTIGFISRRGAASRLQRLAGLQSLLIVASSVLFLAAISLPFDFHECAYPSRQLPFFVSGRVISGVMLPLVLIYASGLEMVTNLFRKWVPPVALLAFLMVAVTASEIRVRSVVFSSPYNFFALSGWRH